LSSISQSPAKDLLATLVSSSYHARSTSGPTKRPTAPPGRARIRLGQLKSRSVTKRIAVLHDMIHDHNLDVNAITETYIRDSAPDAIKLGVAPAGFFVLDAHRLSALADAGVSVYECVANRRVVRPHQKTVGGGAVKQAGKNTKRRGGDLGLVYQDKLSISRVSFQDPLIKDLPRTSYELLLARLSYVRCTVFVGVIYQPPSTSLPTFVTEFTSLVDKLASTNLVLGGDFNCRHIGLDLCRRFLLRSPTRSSLK